MATAERQVTLAESPEAALQTCVGAPTRAGFKNVNAGRGFVSAQKRLVGQWTKGQITLTVAADGQQARVTIMAQATAQSLMGLASSPSQRMVDKVAQELGG
jgi:hypothetical protein